MEQEPLFLKPVFKERIWGGTKLQELFGYDIPSEQTGECWGISAHQNGPNEILNGPLQGKTLDEVWQSHRELFDGEEGEVFPLLVKILDAKQDLSVQVHPDDAYAQDVEKESYGKTECWYVLDCEAGAEIIFGHHAQTQAELESMVEDGQWSDLLRRVQVKPGDFFYVPSGTIHAIGAGVQILETQQSSDITYRVYDYYRKGADGSKRELHLEKSLDVTQVPHVDPELQRTTTRAVDLKQETLIEEDNFSVYHWHINGTSASLRNPSYLLMSVVAGSGQVKTKEGSTSFQKGDHFILPATITSFHLKGNAELLVSHSN
ncbi:mannose-6-phosphate isomerase, class I [Thalassobacillus sp. CUG 92003]|uniref:mannose-6-phosphate isomerase, class I n=1 Tax=Thalassobacillus sp. CUG 92003 TaxID=2736641 RepID=UPI0015E64575|nr:mannose-6-phosphate isomerase, class I [Thalassobacillus sp. CUG 92003]